MAFQFQCPNGHLLEGDESQVSQQCTCPICGILFLIPAPLGAAPAPQMYVPLAPMPHVPMPYVPATPGAPFAVPSTPPGPPSFPSFAGTSGGVPADAPVIHVGGSPGGPAVDVTAPAEPRLLHIPCPNGHELEVPPDMLEQDVLCPHCNAQFHLREKNSVEYKRKKEIEMERRDFKRGQAWLNWAIATAVIVVIGLIIMFAASR